jgi:poly(A) polymerase
MQDIERKRIVLIGDPDERMREDPVRMLRAVRFAAKLGFTIDEAVASAIRQDLPLLSNVPAARLFDEFLKMFETGHGERTFELLREFRLFGELFPATDEELDADPAFREFVVAALQNTDKRVRKDQSVTPMFLIGAFLWAPAKKLAESHRAEEKMSESQALSVAAYELSGQQQRRISIPKRFTVPMREMLALQPRFHQMHGKRAMKLLAHRRFRAAYDFMLLLAEAGEVDAGTAAFWTRVQRESAEQRAESFQLQAAPKGKRRRRRRRKRARPADST